MSRNDNQKQNQSYIISIWEEEKERYNKKGSGLLVGIVFAILYIIYVPKFGFYIWPLVLQAMNYYQIENWQVNVYFTWFFSIVYFLLLNLLTLILYKNEFPYFEQYKIQKKPWPWNTNEKEWNAMIKKTIGLVMFNNFVVVGMVLYAQNKFSNFKVRQSFKLEDLADSYTMAWQLLFSLILEDFAFHLSHRLLHIKTIYPYVHKVHHQYSQTIGIASEYAHPIEFIFGNIFPVVLPALILGEKMHYFTYLVWISVRLSNTVNAHSGYEIPWVPFGLMPFQVPPNYHDFHHSDNIGNYSGFFRVWDSLFNDNDVYYRECMRKRKDNKKQ